MFGKHRHKDDSLVEQLHRHTRDLRERDVPLFEFALWHTLLDTIAEIDAEDLDNDAVLEDFAYAFMEALEMFSAIEVDAFDGPIPAVVDDFHREVIRGFQSFDSDGSFAIFLTRIPAIVQGESARADSEDEFAAGVLQWLMISLMCGADLEPPSEEQVVAAQFGVGWFFEMISVDDTASDITELDTFGDYDITNMAERDMSFGQQLVRGIYESMGIDHEWSVLTETGFAWWPYRLLQTVFTAPFAAPDIPDSLEEIRQRIDLVRIRGPVSAVVGQVNAFNHAAVLGAFVIDPDEGVVAFSSRVKMSRDNIWMDSLLKMACASSAVMAERDIELIASELPGTPMWSQSPVNGPRPHPDDLVDPGSDFFDIARSTKAVPIGDDWLTSALKQVRPVGITGSLDRGVIRANCSTGGDAADGTALIEINPNGSHPRLGPGIEWSCTLTRDVDGSAASLACSLNWFEAISSPGTHQLGAWVAAENHVTYRAFIPWISLADVRPFDVLVVNILLDAGLHARFGDQLFTADIFEDEIPPYPRRPFHDDPMAASTAE